MPPYLIIAIIAAFFFSLSGLLNKQAMAHGSSPFLVFMVQAWAGTVALSFWIFTGDPISLSLLWQPALAGTLWFMGSVLMIHAIKVGDLSIVGPVAGVKPVFNAIVLAVILRENASLTTWVACGLAATALFVMRTPSSEGSHSFERTVFQTLVAVLFFALADLVIQRWANSWGVLRFVGLHFLMGALLSLSLIPRFGARYCDLLPVARHFLFAGGVLSTLPGILLGFAIGKYGHGAEVNVGYSFHVLFTLWLVWVLGRHIGNTEHKVGAKVFLRRGAGALILLTAIVLIASGK